MNLLIDLSINITFFIIILKLCDIYIILFTFFDMLLWNVMIIFY